MARIKPSSAPAMSLFAFMSILACLSGALVVMICVLTMVRATTAGKTAGKKNPQAEEMMKVQAQMAEFRTITDQLSIVEQNERKLVTLQEITQGEETTDAVRARIQKEIENGRLTAANLRNEQPRVQKEIAKLKEDIAERKMKPEDIRPGLRVQGGGSGFAVGRRLFVVEANSDSIVVHRSKDDRMRIAMSAIGADREYNDFLAEVAGVKSHLVLFLVRTDGMNSYNRGAGWAENQFKVSTSKIPIPGQGKVDLSEFEKFMK